MQVARRLRQALIPFALLCLAAPVCAATYYVSPSGSDSNPGTISAPYKTIQAAVNNASSGDTVTLFSGTASTPDIYTGPGDVDLDMGGKSLTVNSQTGAGSTVIDCAGSSSANHRAFYFHTNETSATINGLTIKDGFENANDGGSAIDIATGCTVTLSNCTFSSNTGYSGTVRCRGNVTMTSCTFSSNAGGTGASSSTACADLDGTEKLTDCIFTKNTVPTYNGSILSLGGAATLTDCNIISNTGPGVSCNATLSMTGCTISGCTYTGISVSGNSTLTNCTISSNVSPSNGGAIYVSTSNSNNVVNLENCTISGNTAPNGGAIYNYTGETVLSDCTLSNNSAVSGNGGGVYNNANQYFPAYTTLTNCVLTGNTATGNGGGIYTGGATSTLTLQFCSIYSNNVTGANSQGGALENDGVATLTDDILWGNTASYAASIGTTSSANPVTTVTYSDIQGGYSGTGNINANPLFVSSTDLHLQTGSPCLHKGIAISGVTTDITRATRANPPSMGAYENGVAAPTHTWTAVSVSTGADGFTRLLWDNTNGTAAVWKVNSAGSFTQQQYGPYAGWTAKAIATGSDNQTRLLWTNTNGAAAYYLLDSNNAFVTQQQYGPYDGWTAQGLSVEPDSTVRALWTNSNGTATVWTLNASNQLTTQAQYGPYAGWTAKAIATNPDGSERMLWTNTDGTATFWHLDSGSNLQYQQQYGPYTGYTAASIASSPDGSGRVVWLGSDAHIALWTINSANAFTSQQYQYGPYAGFSFTGIAVGSDGNARLLWDNASGLTALWSLTPTGGFASNYQFGPY